VELIEDEILEDYLDGNLRNNEKLAVEQHFLRPPERQRKLWFIRLLRGHLSKEERHQRRSRWFPPPYLQIHWKTFGGFAALLFISIFLGTYAIQLRLELQAQKDSSEKESREITRLQQEITALRNTGTTSQSDTKERYLAVNLVPGNRGDTSANEDIRFDSGQRGLEIHVPSIQKSIHSYKAVLQNAGEEPLWSSTDVKPDESGREVVIKIPGTLPPGSYSLVLSSNATPTSPVQKHHPFRVVAKP